MLKFGFVAPWVRDGLILRFGVADWISNMSTITRSSSTWVEKAATERGVS